MLRRLSLRDFVIVCELDIELGAGFTALTGETGAGKSILIDALQLTLGSRGDAGVVREGAARADLSAEFDVSPALAAQLRPWLEEAGFDTAELDERGGRLLLRRVVDAQGKSRAWVNGGTATLAQLRELGEQLVDIHGQHAWQSLTRADSVRALVDAQAAVDTAALQSSWAARREARRRLDEARARQADLERERERLQWQIGELAKLAPQPDEWEALNAEHTRLSHGQSILDAARVALDMVSEAELNAEGLTSRAIDALDEVAGVEPRLVNALEVLREAQAQLQDAAHSLNGVLGHTELDPDRLGELDARLSAWMGLARRYRRQAHELPELLQAWQAELTELDAATDLAALERDATQAHAAWLKAAQAASKLRKQAAPKLSEAVTAAMQTLGMAGGRFEVAFLVALGQSLLGNYALAKEVVPLVQEGDPLGKVYHLTLRPVAERQCYFTDPELALYLDFARMRQSPRDPAHFTRVLNAEEGFTPPGLLFGLSYAWYLDNRFASHIEYKMAITRAEVSDLVPAQVKSQARRLEMIDFFRTVVFRQ